MKNAFFLGIDIGGTKCVVLAGSEKMTIYERVQFPTETQRGPGYAINKLLVAAQNIVNNLPDKDLVCIGISCGGPLDSRAGMILSPPNLPGWDELAITEIFKNKFGVEAYLQNDANACALAEFKFGAGKGIENMVFLTFGTGLGAGIIMDGELYSGTNDLAGEVGHIRLAKEGPTGYGKEGSFEGFCSGAGIARMGKKIAISKLKKGEKIWFVETEEDIQRITTKYLANAAVSGDVTAMEIFRESGRYLGMGLSIIIDILNPQRIIIGGVYARHPDLFNPTSHQVIKQEALKSAAEVCEILPAGLGEKLGDFASLSIAITHSDRTHVLKRTNSVNG